MQWQSQLTIMALWAYAAVLERTRDWTGAHEAASKSTDVHTVQAVYHHWDEAWLTGSLAHWTDGRHEQRWSFHVWARGVVHVMMKSLHSEGRHGHQSVSRRAETNQHTKRYASYRFSHNIHGSPSSNSIPNRRERSELTRD